MQFEGGFLLKKKGYSRVCFYSGKKPVERKIQRPMSIKNGVTDRNKVSERNPGDGL